ncbi:MAG: anti-sigma factor family protein [Terriglobia bacterium]
MTREHPDWEDLNAYVDGELDAHDSARVARSVAIDPGLADQVATLTRLKAAVADTLELVDLPPVGPKRRLLWYGVAAAVALIVVAEVGSYVAPWRHQADAGLLRRAHTAHRTWIERDNADSVREVGAGVLLSALHRLGPETYVPDLSASRLTISMVATVPASGVDGPALHIGYRGTRGCRVSFWISSDHANLGSRLVERRVGPLRSFVWRAGSLAYVLINSGMDEGRFTLIARTVHRATLERLPLDAEMRTALRESREASMPCSG